MTYHSHADLGGREGQGPVIPEGEHELFHAPWEKQALALTLAMGATGAWNLDMSRCARETLPNYASLSYYQLWIEGLEKLLLGRGMITADELETGRMLYPPRPVARVLHSGQVPAVLATGAPTGRPATTSPRFRPGDRVRTRPSQVEHHTRLPGYARGKLGQIEIVQGVHVFADAHALGLGEQPQWLYTVTFSGRELWGPEAADKLVVSIDAWEPYLESVK